MSHLQQRLFCLEVKKEHPDFFKNKKVLDCGSLDINGNNRFLFEDCEYTGIDIGKGNNVDIVSTIHEFNDYSSSYDVIISTECFEHDMFYEKSLNNILRLLKPGGLFLFTCATTGRPEHGTPKTSAQDSPFTSITENWSSYYKNLEENDIRNAINLEETFSCFKFKTNLNPADLYFFGIKKEIDYSQSLSDHFSNENLYTSKLNIIIRTCERPVYFKNLINSIRKYCPESTLHIIIDDKKNLKYVLKNIKDFNYAYYLIDKEKILEISKSLEQKNRIFIPNLYYNVIKSFLKGFCLFLDDDDELLCNPDLSDLNTDSIYLHKFKFYDKLIPEPEYFGKGIFKNHISGTSVIFHSSQFVDWKSYSGGDYYFISELFKKNKTVWINKVLTSGQQGCHLGEKIDYKIYTIAICIPFYQRDKVTKFVFKYYSDLKKQLNGKLNLILLASGSEKQKSRKIAESFGFFYFEVENNPLAQKHNILYTEAKKFNPDACLKIDSDSIISVEFFDFYIENLNNNIDYSEILDIYFATKNNLCHWDGYKDERINEGTGVGRFLSRNLLNKLNWMPWSNSERNYGFDKVLSDQVNKFSDIKRNRIKCEDINGFCIDLKCKQSLTSLTYFTFDKIFPINHFNIDFSEISDELFEQNNLEDKLQNTNYFSVIIPTLWLCNDLLKKMISIYNDSPFIKEIIIIDNRPDFSIKFKSKKIKILSRGKNIYVNAAWNWGVKEAICENLIIANDDLFINPTDFNNLMSLINIEISNKKVIGIDKSCYINQTSNVFIKKENNNKFESTGKDSGFGVMMFIKKESYIPINENIKIWFGDNLQFFNNEVFKINGIHIDGILSTSINNKDFNLRKIAEQDITLLPKYYDEKFQPLKIITFNLASFPDRKTKLEVIIEKLLSIDIIDKIRVYLNEYKEVPEFLINDKIEYVIGQKDIKDSGKFFWANTLKKELYFSGDEDILINKEYILNHIELLKKYDNNVFVSLHGRLIAENATSFENATKGFHFASSLDQDTFINVPGTGVMVFDNSKFSISHDFFKYHGMVDLFIAKYCQEKSIPCVCRSHNKNEIVSLWFGTENTLFHKRDEFLKFHQEIFDSVKPWKVFDPELKIESFKPPKEFSVIKKSFNAI